jgi:adenylate cyclase
MSWCALSAKASANTAENIEQRAQPRAEAGSRASWEHRSTAVTIVSNCRCSGSATPHAGPASSSRRPRPALHAGPGQLLTEAGAAPHGGRRVPPAGSRVGPGYDLRRADCRRVDRQHGRPTGATMSARRVLRSFAFLDLCGFTAYIDERGDEDAVEALSAMRAAIRSAAEEHGVRVAKWLGDGAMLVGVEHGPLTQCALAIQAEMPAGPSPPLRGGVCTGQVLLFEGDDYVGRAVNIAARLCAAAAPGQILVADGGLSTSEADLGAPMAAGHDGTAPEGMDETTSRGSDAAAPDDLVTQAPRLVESEGELDLAALEPHVDGRPLRAIEVRGLSSSIRVRQFDRRRPAR